MNKYKQLIYHLICVPTCASCGERLSPFAKNDSIDQGYLCLCDKCMDRWRTACVQMCHTCSGVAADCTCMPRKKTFVQPSIPSLFFYHPDTSRSESKVIYTLKHKNNAELFKYISAELCPKLESLLSELEISLDDCILTYIPRTRKAQIKNGFDQGEILCRTMSRDLCAAYAPLLVREGGVEQKRLSKYERNQNANKAIFANTELKGVRIQKEGKTISELLYKKTVIIVEDVITTGATVARAIKCLRDAGAESVLVCAVARSEISTDKKKNTENSSIK